MTDGDRRREVLDHARSVIIRDGLHTMSLRRISREGGYTTGVLSHHFADKRELIAATFEWTTTNWLDRAEEELEAAATAQESVSTFVRIAVPFAAERQGEWRLWLEYCVAAVGDSALGELLLRLDTRWERITAAAFSRWEAAGLVKGTMPLAEQAATLVRVVDGLGLRALLTGDWDAAREGLAGILRSLGLPAAVAAASLRPPEAKS